VTTHHNRICGKMQIDAKKAALHRRPLPDALEPRWSFRRSRERCLGHIGAQLLNMAEVKLF
jgi:hypothetical protein